MIVEATGQVAAVFETASTSTSKAPPLYTLVSLYIGTCSGGAQGVFSCLKQTFPLQHSHFSALRQGLDAGSIETSGAGGTIALPLFPGPSCRVLPLPAAPAAPEEYIASEDEDEHPLAAQGSDAEAAWEGNGGGDFYVPGGRLLGMGSLRSVSSVRSAGGGAGTGGGLGVMVWVTGDGCLAAATLPAAGGAGTGKVRLSGVGLSVDGIISTLL